MILFVDQSGQLGGAELCLADLAAHHGKNARVLLFSEGPFADFLRERHVNVGILPLRASASRVTKKASPAALAASLPALFSHVRGISREIRSADLAYFNTAKALVYGSAANFLARRPSIFHLHDLWDRRHFSATNIRLLVASANRATAVIANSTATADTFVAVGGTAPVHVVPNGFDPAPFDTVSNDDISRLRKELNPEGQPVVAIFGRLARWKGQDVLLRASEKVRDLTIWIVGDALFTGDDRAYADELREHAKKLGSRVRFLGFRSDIPALMRAADIVAHCSVSAEPFGRVIVEAMLARKPVVATQAGGPKEIVENGATGILTPTGDAEALAQALGKLIASPALRESMGQKGRARAEKLYALPVILQKTDAVIASILKK